MRCRGIARPTWMSGDVTSIPSFTRSGRSLASFRSSSPLGNTLTALRVSSATPMARRTLPLQFRGSVSPTTFRRGAAPGPAPDPEASPLRTAGPPRSAGLGLLQRRSRHCDRRRDSGARPEPDPQPDRRLRLRRQRPGALRAQGLAEPGPAPLRRDLTADEAGNRRDRGQTLLRAPGRRPPRGHARRLGRRAWGPGGPGWLYDHAAVRQEHVHAQPALDRAQAEGGGARVAARAALVEGSNPDRVPEHDLLRERRLRRRAGCPDVLPPRRRTRETDARRGRLAGGDPRGPDGVRSGDEPERGAPAPERRPARDARPGRHHPGRLRTRS